MKLCLLTVAPVCSNTQPKKYGAGLKEGIDVTCSVESYPTPLSFRWSFNNSNEIVEIPTNFFSSSSNVSTLRYVPHTPSDFGTALCWAANDVGLMKEPCAINIIPAGKSLLQLS